MVMEFASEQAVPWMSPNDATEEMILSLAKVGKLPHPGGAQAVCVSGNVLYLRADSKPAALRALISIAGDDDAVAQAAN